MSRFLTIEDGIEFQRIKLLPRRSHYYGVHRRLVGEYNKSLQVYQRDIQMFHNSLQRTKSFYKEKLYNLKRMQYSGKVTSSACVKSCLSDKSNGDPDRLRREVTMMDSVFISRFSSAKREFTALPKVHTF